MSDTLERLQSALAESYAIQREIGRGGMATVYLATDRKHNRPVALKVLHPELAASVGHERFLREIEIVAGLTHPRILTLIDSGEADGLLYFVMPFVEGETLAARLEREGQLPVEDSVRIAREIADALSYAHGKGVIHRDIKPSNILFEAGHSVIADFGVARAVDVAGDGDATATGLTVGTPRYMSPEQALGGDVDGRSDVYALGCVLWEMLAGASPYTGPTPSAIIARKSSETLPALSVRRKSVPPGVEDVVVRALAPNPADRFASAAEFERALAKPETVVGSRRRPQGRARSWARVAAVVALLAVVAFGAWRLAGGTAEAEAADAYSMVVLPFEARTENPDDVYLVDGLHKALISELGQVDGLRVISFRSANRYAGTDKTVPEIAAELGVDGVIEATVTREDGSVEVALAFIEAVPEERLLWTDVLERRSDDTYGMYGDAVRSITGEVGVELSAADAESLSRTRSVNPEVYEAYLRGMYHLNQGTPDDLQKGIEYLEAAIAIDPGDPMVYAGLALGYATLGHGPAPPPGVWDKARAAAERAVRLDSTLAEGHAAMADVKVYSEWDWAGAERAFRRANELNPSLAMNHFHYAWFLLLMGRFDEALEEHELARTIDPLTPSHTVWIPGLHLYSGDLEAALDGARELTERYPGHPVALFVRGQAAAALGLFDEAIAAHEELAEVDPLWISPLGVTYAQAGREDDAGRILAEIEALPVNGWTALGMADLNAALGDTDEALRWLDYEPAHAWLPWIRTSPAYDGLRDDPRFKALLAKLDFP